MDRGFARPVLLEITLTLPQRALSYVIGIGLAQVLNMACPLWFEVCFTFILIGGVGLVLRWISQHKSLKEATLWLNCCVVFIWLFLGMFHGAGFAWPGVDSGQLIGQTVAGQGKIVSVKTMESKQDTGPRLQIELKIKEHIKMDHFDQDQLWQKQGAVILIIRFSQNVKEHEIVPDKLFPGVFISFMGQVIITEGPRNPGAFDYPVYLAAQGIYTRIDVQPYQVKIYKKTNPFSGWLNDLRQDLRQQIQSHLPNEEAGIVEGCLLGITDQMEDGDLEVYRQAGIAHLFAVSGSHGAIILALAASLNGLWPGRQRLWTDWLLSVGLLLFYVALTGFPLSMLRTLLMAILMMSATLIGRKGNSLIAFAAALIILLWLSPGSLQLAGFQLSFGVVLGLLRLGPWLKKQGCPVYFAIPIAAQLASMPLLAFWFNQFQPLSALINLFVMFLMGPLMILALSAGFISCISISLSSIFWWSSGLLAWLMHHASIIWTKMPWSYWYIGSHAWPAYILWGIGLWLLPEIVYYDTALGNWLSYINVKHYLLKGKQSFVGIVIIFILFNCFNSNALEVVFLDVGEGDCMVIHTPKGKTWLIDGGGTPFSDYEVGKQTILPYLKHRGINNIEGIFLSHHHQDHREGLTELLKNIPVSFLWMPPLQESNEGDQAFQDALIQSSAQVHIVKTAYQQIKLEKGMQVDLWWPRAWGEQSTQWQGNNSSLVIRLDYKDKQSWLLTGDIEILGLEMLLSHTNRQALQSQVLKLPHHGSMTSYLPEFYEAVKPAGVVITGGKNKIGNLGNEVGQWFKKAQVPLWSTRHQGAVITKVNNTKIVVRTIIKEPFLIK